MTAKDIQARYAIGYLRKVAQAESDGTGIKFPKISFDSLKNISRADVKDFLMKPRNSSAVGAGLGGLLGTLFSGRDAKGKTHRLRNMILMMSLGAGLGYGGSMLAGHLSGKVGTPQPGPTTTPSSNGRPSGGHTDGPNSGIH
jgi:hypothetical protein